MCKALNMLSITLNFFNIHIHPANNFIKKNNYKLLTLQRLQVVVSTQIEQFVIQLLSHAPL